MSKQATTTSTDDIDALLASPERPGGKDCHVCWGLAKVPDGDRDRLALVVARRDIPPAKVRPLFSARLDGWAPGETSLLRHRDGKCQQS